MTARVPVRVFALVGVCALISLSAFHTRVMAQPAHGGQPVVPGGGQILPSISNPAERVLDHFLCYQAKGGFSPPQGVSLLDQFSGGQPRPAFPVRLDWLCNPVSKNQGTILFPLAHLVCYGLKSTPLPALPHVFISNQFVQRQPLSVVQESELCLPSGKGNLQSTVPLVIPTVLDHFACYTVRSGGFQARRVFVKDQFLSQLVTVTRLAFLCNPARKFINGKVQATVKHPAAHLACYTLAPVRFAGRRVRVVNQFQSTAVVSVIRPALLCLPSTKQVV